MRADMSGVCAERGLKGPLSVCNALSKRCGLERPRGCRDQEDHAGLRVATTGHITRACSSVSSAPAVWISTSVNASWRQVIGWKMAVFLLSWARAAVTPLATPLRPLAPSGLAMNIVVRDTVCTPLFLCFDLLFVPSILFQAFSRLRLCRISQLLCRYAGHIYQACIRVCIGMYTSVIGNMHKSYIYSI